MAQQDHKAPVRLLFEDGYQKSPRIHPTGFLDLPFELQAPIYIMVLRPDCSLTKSPCTKNHQHTDMFLGCTAILMTCSQVYREAIELLHQGEVHLELDRDAQNVFLGPREFGKHGYFGSSGWNWQELRTEPFKFDELQFIRMRKVVLVVRFSSAEIDNDDFVHGAKYFKVIRKKVTEAATALGKSRTLEAFRVIFDQELGWNTWDQMVESHKEAKKKSLRPLIDAARRAGFDLILDERYYNTIDDARADPVIDWMYKTAVKAELPTELFNTFPKPTAPGEDTDGQGTEQDGLLSSEDDSVNLPKVLKKDFFIPLQAANKYELVPECRTCYETFRDWSELAEHLTKQPKHKKSFVNEHFNKLHRTATRTFVGVMIRCPTCACPFEYRRHVDGHKRECHHHCVVRIPRYREANKRRFERRFQRCGAY